MVEENNGYIETDATMKTDVTMKMQGEQSKAKSKVWLEKGDNVIYGDGRQVLLLAIEQTGSIRQAASRLGMSYRAAWGKIKATEERLGIELVSKKAGGTDSGTNLTENGKEFMKKYEQFKKESNEAVDAIHRKYFG